MTVKNNKLMIIGVLLVLLYSCYKEKRYVHLEVYPNPVMSNLNISYQISEPQILEITDISGRIVFSKWLENTNDKITLNVENYSQGNYLIKLRNKRNSLITFKKL